MSGIKTLKNVFYVRKIKQNLVSVRQLLEFGYSLYFNDEMCNIRDKIRILLLYVKMMNRSFNIDLKKACLSVNACVYTDFILWHKRLGHFNYATLKMMADLQMASGLPEIQEQQDICEVCQLGKQTRIVFPDNAFRASSKL